MAALNPALEHDLWVLLRLAREDSEPAVRREAVRHLTDPEVLTQIQRRDLDDSVREAATIRLHALLAGQVPSPLALAQRLAHIEGISQLQAVDLRYAEQLGYRIKLLGITRRTTVDGKEGIELRVHPTLVPGARLIARQPAHVDAADRDALGDGVALGVVIGRRPGCEHAEQRQDGNDGDERS